MFSFDQKGQVAYLKGVDSLFTKVTPFSDKKTLQGGEWLLQHSRQVVSGYGVFSKLSLGLFDLNRALEVYVPKTGKNTVFNKEEDVFNIDQLIVTGVYSINEEVDNKYIFCSLDLAQRLLEFKPNQYTAIEIKLAPNAREGRLRDDLESIFKNKVTIQNRAQLNESLYKMLNAENLVTYLFCSLVVVLTLFCLAGALIMLILDKKENIKTLYNLGAEVNSLRRIFFYQGIFITALGTFFGLLIGFIIIILQQQFAIVMVSGTMPYPTAITAFNIIVVVATIFVLGVLASWIAATRINKSLLEIA